MSLYELVDFIQTLKQKCPYNYNITLENYIHYIKSELNEVQEALKNEDNVALKEELGDLFFDVVAAIVIADFSIDDIVTQTYKKFTKRHSHVLSEGKINIADCYKSKNG